MKAAASPVTERSSSAHIRVNFRASQLYQAPGFSPYELSLELEASDNNETVSDWTVVNVGVGQRLKAAFEESRHNHDRAGFQPLCSLSRMAAIFGMANRWVLNTHREATFSLDL
jgi:hypothetical protein